MAEVGLREVALRAQVSIGTVSNVLNQPGIVAAATRARVIAAIDELGYIPNVAGRVLRSGRSHVFGMAVIDLVNPFFAELVLGAESVAEAAGYTIMVSNSDDSPQKERAAVEHFERQRMDGVLIAPVRGSFVDLARVASRRAPVVLVDRDDPSGVFSAVSLDDIAGGHLAAEHLIEGGRRRIVFVGGPLDLTQMRERLEGAHAAAQTAGISLGVMETANLNSRLGREIAERVADLPAGERPDGIVAANDLVALGLMQGLLRRGIRIPDEIAIVGYDDIEFAETAIVPLTSIRQPAFEMGRRAAELLLARVGGGPIERARFDPVLVVRESSRGA